MKKTHTHYCIKQMITKNLLYSTGISTQQFVMTYMGKKNGDIYIYTHTHTHIYTHIYIHTHTYIHILIYVCVYI